MLSQLGGGIFGAHHLPVWFQAEIVSKSSGFFRDLLSAGHEQKGFRQAVIGASVQRRHPRGLMLVYLKIVEVHGGRPKDALVKLPLPSWSFHGFNTLTLSFSAQSPINKKAGAIILTDRLLGILTYDTDVHAWILKGWKFLFSSR